MYLDEKQSHLSNPNPSLGHLVHNLTLPNHVLGKVGDKFITCFIVVTCKSGYGCHCLHFSPGINCITSSFILALILRNLKFTKSEADINSTENLELVSSHGG